MLLGCAEIAIMVHNCRVSSDHFPALVLDITSLAADSPPGVVLQRWQSTSTSSQ